MDYNRVQSYIKSHVLPKLDSLQTGMDGIPNLLTPSFDSIKNVLSTITTKVDNVRGGVDLNHTALTDLQQILTAVEGSVGQVQQDVGKVQAKVSNSARNKPAKFIETRVVAGEKKTVLNISGKGALHYVSFMTQEKSKGVTLTIEIDGKRVDLIYNYDSYGYLALYTTEAFFNSGNSNLAYTRTELNKTAEGYNFDDFSIAFPPAVYSEELFVKPLVQLKIESRYNYGVGREESYKFEKSLKITVDCSMVPSSSSSPSKNLTCLYSLE